MTSAVSKDYIKRRKSQVNLRNGPLGGSPPAAKGGGVRVWEMKRNEILAFLQILRSPSRTSATSSHLLICFLLVVKMRSAQISILAPKLVFPAISSEAGWIYLVFSEVFLAEINNRGIYCSV